MKKYYLSLAISSLLLFSGCSEENPPAETTTNQSVQKLSLTYSNLNDHQTLQEIVDGLSAHGIQKENIDMFQKSIADYNQKMGSALLVNKGFQKIDMPSVSYDEVKIIEKWDSLALPYLDVNCRITSFQLFNQFITSDYKYKDESLELIFDLQEIIGKNPNAQFSRNDIQKFKNIFSPISTEDTTDIKKHVEMIKKEWKQREISFTNNESISLVNIFLHSPEENNLFIGHTGVLMKEKDGYVFIEKLAQAMPYQALKFQTKDELYTYLMKLYDVNTGDYAKIAAKPIIMENDQLLKVEN